MRDAEAKGLRRVVRELAHIGECRTELEVGCRKLEDDDAEVR